jgi:farnesyl-diphosphate farnesyltransferase
LNQTDTQSGSWGFCAGILPGVSRSFAMIIPQCPEPLDRAMCVAYLICRLADTVEDDVSLSDDQRTVLYDALLAAVDAPTDSALAEAFPKAWLKLPEGDYGTLVEGTAHVMAAYATLPEALGGPIRTCVHDMITGMRSMRVAAHRDGISFMCRDMGDLERYCHYVAGTVGIMSTTLFETRLGPAGFTADDGWREDGRRLGLGLQMTNIIKDCRVDAQRQVSFIPPDCVDPGQSAYRLKPTSKAELMNRCIGHLDAGLRYSLAVPASESGIRTFLLGSLLPAIATLEVAAQGTELHPKIDRLKMAEIFELITISVGDDAAIRDWYTDHRRRTLRLASA